MPQHPTTLERARSLANAVAERLNHPTGGGCVDDQWESLDNEMYMFHGSTEDDLWRDLAAYYDFAHEERPINPPENGVSYGWMYRVGATAHAVYELLTRGVHVNTQAVCNRNGALITRSPDRYWKTSKDLSETLTIGSESDKRFGIPQDAWKPIHYRMALGWDESRILYWNEDGEERPRGFIACTVQDQTKELSGKQRVMGDSTVKTFRACEVPKLQVQRIGFTGNIPTANGYPRFSAESVAITIASELVRTAKYLSAALVLSMKTEH